MQRLLTQPPNSEMAAISGRNPRPRVLSITADTAFYAGVLNAASSAGWRTDWARSLNRAMEMGRRQSTRIVIYDRRLPGVDWESAFERLSTLPQSPRLLLAAPSIDEELWRNVLLRHGYDVVRRSASSVELSQAFRFAWLSLLDPAGI